MFVLLLRLEGRFGELCWMGGCFCRVGQEGLFLDDDVELPDEDDLNA